jgi:hypothetical protein
MKYVLWFLCFVSLAAAADLRVAAFRADVTPQLGEPLIWTTPAKTVHDPLWAKGIVIQSGRDRFVLCAIDWCGLGNRTHLLFRRKLAEALSTDLSRVTVHSVHQHTAPYIDSTAYDLLRKLGAPPLEFSDASLEALASRVGRAAREALGNLAAFDRVGVSSVQVERVASARRLTSADGKAITRYSTSGKQRAMADAPEGDVDTLLRTITLADGKRPLVRLHYYATHPQTFCCEGTVSGDFAGAARETLEREEKIPQLYFTGAAGDVTVGKYNDGEPSAREALAARLLDAMRRASAGTRFASVEKLTWSTVPLALPTRKDLEAVDVHATEDLRYKRAIAAVFVSRVSPLETTALHLGAVHIVHMPGEPMLAFQRFAQSLKPGEFVAFAGYGDVAPGYICTDLAYTEGGYEPSASNTQPGAESLVKAALRKLLQ